MSGRIAERFTQVVTLESGKLGTLSRAYDEQLGAPALLLQLSEHARGSDDVLQAVLDDNRRLAGQGRALLAYAWGRAAGQAWIASEATEGALVEDALKRRDKLEMPQLLRLAKALAEAAQGAEAAGVAHFDLGPHRLWAEGEGLAGAIRVFGFGWWRLLPAVTAQPTDLFYGAPEYLAAEICKGQSGTPASEVYAAATTVWTMAATKPPFQSSQPLMTLKRQAVEKPLRLDLVKPALKGIKDLQGLVGEALDKDPAKRPTATAWLAAIDTLAATWAPDAVACGVPAHRAAALSGAAAVVQPAVAGAEPAAPVALAPAAAAPESAAAAPAPAATTAPAAAELDPAPAVAAAERAAAEGAAAEGAAAAQPAAAAAVAPAPVPAPATAAAEPVAAAALLASTPDATEDDDSDEEDEGDAAPGAAGGAGRRGKKGKKGKRDRQAIPPASAPAKADTRPGPAVAVKVEATKIEPARAEPAKTEPSKAEPAKVEPAKVEPAKVEPAKVEPGKLGVAVPGPAKAEPAKVEPSKPVASGASLAKDSGKFAGGNRAVKTTDRVRVEQMHETAFFDADHEPPKDLADQGPPVPPPTKVSKPLVAFLALFALAMIGTAAVLMLKEPPEVPAPPAAEAPAVAEPAEAAPVAPVPPPPAPAPVEEVAAAPVEVDAAGAAAPEVAAEVAAAPPEDPAAKAKALVDEGENLLRAKQADAALAKAKQALEANPGFAPAAALQTQAEAAAAEAAKAAAEAAKVASEQQQAAAASAAKATEEAEAKRKVEEQQAQKAEAVRQKQAAAEEEARKKADAAAAKKAAAAQAKEAAQAQAKAKAAEEPKKPKEPAKVVPPPVKKDPPPVVSNRPPPAGEPSEAQKEAAKFAALAQKANTAKLKVLYLRKATEKDPGNGQYKNLLKQAEGELANQQPSP